MMEPYQLQLEGLRNVEKLSEIMHTGLVCVLEK